jgi:hypothetical protein
MEDWQLLFETTAAEMEKFFHQLGIVVESFAEEVSSTILNCVEQIQEVVIPEIDQEIEDFWKLLLDVEIEGEDIFWQDLENFSEESEFVSVNIENPTPDQHSACIGCQHYHGRVYGNNLLVCAMHPYGWDDKTCPDWEENLYNKVDFYQ